MGKLTVLALRVLLALVLAGSVFVQAVMVPLLAVDLGEAGAAMAGVRVPVVVIVLLGFVTVQVTLVCVWRLLAMVQRGTVFSQGAFRYVDIIGGAGRSRCTRRGAADRRGRAAHFLRGPDRPGTADAAGPAKNGRGHVGRAGRHHARQPVNPQERPGQGRTLQHPRGPVQGQRLPARGRNSAALSELRRAGFVVVELQDNYTHGKAWHRALPRSG
ncbi:hypothetical protein ART_3656 [Arthrobacter sp. PAMC 25486]|nr:hypothetical protein ART_3656 [Arthrobacter sp. PAMC 25486]